MSEASGSDKRAIQQQASAIMSSVISQEKVVTYLRSLDLPEGGDDAGDDARVLADLIDTVHSARQDLVNYMDFLGVAHDHGWDAARIYHDEPDDASSKRVQSAVAKAKKKREASEKEKKKKKSRRSSSYSSSKRKRDTESDKSSCSHSHAHSTSHCCQAQPYQKQFRSTQNLPCIRCGDTAHHWRQCPKPATK